MSNIYTQVAILSCIMHQSTICLVAWYVKRSSPSVCKNSKLGISQCMVSAVLYKTDVSEQVLGLSPLGLKYVAEEDCNEILCYVYTLLSQV